MMWLIAQMLVYLVASATLGLIVGWLVGRNAGQDVLDARWRSKYDSVHDELVVSRRASDAHVSRIAALERDLHQGERVLAARDETLRDLEAREQASDAHARALEHDRDVLHAQLRTKEALTARLESDLGVRETRNEELVRALHAVSADLGATKGHLAERETEVTHLRGERTRLEGALRSSREETATLKAHVDATMRSAAREVDGLRAQVASLGAAVASTKAERVDALALAQARLTALTQRERQLIHLQAEHASARAAVARQHAEFAALQRAAAHEQQAHEELTATVRAMDTELADLRTRVATQAVSLSAAADERRAMRAELQRREAAVAATAAATDAVQQLRAELASKQQEASEYLHRLSELDAAREEVAARDRHLTLARAELEAAEAERSRMTAAFHAVQRQLTERQTALGRLHAELHLTSGRVDERDRLLAHRDQLIAQQHADAERRLAVLEAQLAERNQAIATLRERRAQEVDRRAARAREARAERDRAIQQRAEAEATVQALQERLAAVEAQVTEVGQRQSTDREVGVQAVMHADRTPPAGHDDLKRILGVGPVLERTLHALGILTFREIARWTSDDIARVDAQLAHFHGRIARDDWVAQATQLHREVYGEAP